MTSTEAPAFPIFTDTWTLSRMREAAAFRAENPSTSAAEQATDAWLDAQYAACLAAVAEVGTVTERPGTESVQDTLRRGDAVASGARGSNYSSTRNAPSDAQLRFLTSLCRDLGWTLGQDIPQPRDKAHASLLIDQGKKAVAALRASGTAAPAARPERKATERQVEFLADLLNERAHAYGEDLDPAELSAARASALITELRDAPRAKVAAHGIREGRYAYTTDGGATADHYRITRGGKIMTWTASGEYPYTGKGLNEALTWIKENPREAAALFGQLTESCGRCGRDLSDDDSRARGLGPVCAGKSDW